MACRQGAEALPRVVHPYNLQRYEKSVSHRHRHPGKHRGRMSGNKTLGQTRVANDRGPSRPGAGRPGTASGSGMGTSPSAPGTRASTASRWSRPASRTATVCAWRPHADRAFRRRDPREGDKTNARSMAEYASRFQDIPRVNEYRSGGWESQRRLLSSHNSSCVRQPAMTRATWTTGCTNKDRTYGVIETYRQAIEASSAGWTTSSGTRTTPTAWTACSRRWMASAPVLSRPLQKMVLVVSEKKKLFVPLKKEKHYLRSMEHVGQANNSMKSRNLFIVVIGLILCVSCTSKHLISDADERAAVQNDFAKRCDKLGQGDLFEIFNQPMDDMQREAMVFLYAYMPLADIANHSGEYFLENVDYTLRAQQEMPWGKSIPEREFRHFVLPIRVNNENLDDSRKVFYEELKDRVQKLSLYDAVVEVNHWCHEKVAYMPSDARTSSPLASVRTAYGRCGEESAFTVAALRSVGIPARQVYTPRWAHTDDNHAWVEAWVDGTWHFLGACEPEPVLDLGWFNAPASRSMLMHAKVFGAYDGPEEVMCRTPRYTEINVTNNYAPTAKACVKVVDAENNPVADAKVEFKVYNYAEFYTVASRQTDAEGKTSFTAGKGDMLVWASKKGKFGYAKLSFGIDDDVVIKLDQVGGDTRTLELEIIPPVEGANLPVVTPEQRAGNDHRLAVEDSIRNAYVATFMTSSSARKFAEQHGLDPDSTAKLLVASRGNHKVIRDFLMHSEESGKDGFDLLQRISAKDLRDVTLDVLIDHLENSRPYPDAELFSKYVRNPRVSDEMITPYKEFFTQVVPEQDQAAFRSDPVKLATWVNENIKVDEDCNVGCSPISPMGVWRTRVADAHSRDIFFVSMARSLGIPARIDEITGKVQLMDKAGPMDVDFEKPEQAGTQVGRIVANYTPSQHLLDPRYYTHFTISRLTPDGELKLLNYYEGDENVDGTSWNNLLRAGTMLDAGDYLLVTGTRFANGNVLSNLTFFTVRPQETTTIDLIMREDSDDVQVIGNFDSESTYQEADSKKSTSVLSTTGRGYYIIAVLGVGQEPTNHALRDIATLRKDFDEWGRKIILLFPDEENYKKFRQQGYPELPSTVTFGIDTDGSIQRQIVKNMKLPDQTALPLFIIGDTFDRVVFISQGYTIGLGEQLMKVIHNLLVPKSATKGGG